MERELLQRLMAYITENNPELSVCLSPKVSMLDYLNGKVQLVLPTAAAMADEGKNPGDIVSACMDIMTAELRPSKYLFVLALLGSDFPEEYLRMQSAGVLRAETIHLVQTGAEVFRNFGFSEETKDSSLLRNAVIHHIHQHLTE